MDGHTLAVKKDGSFTTCATGHIYLRNGHRIGLEDGSKIIGARELVASLSWEKNSNSGHTYGWTHKSTYQRNVEGGSNYLAFVDILLFYFKQAI